MPLGMSHDYFEAPVYLFPRWFLEFSVCNSVHASLDLLAARKNIYLLYTWGHRCEGETIQVKGIRKNAPSHLGSTLKVLRDLPETRSGMCYWVDSLCIDQDNVRNRNEHVTCMKAIYGRACAVVVWLGQGEERDKNAVETMRHLCQL